MAADLHGLNVSGLNYSNLTDAGAPSMPDLVLNGDSRRDKGVGLLYADEYNQAAYNAYNNAYNYWLWKQQQDYNSPKNQVARLKEAGLNPNFNSIDGTGNASSIPSSSASPRGNIAQNHLQAIGTAISMATGMAGMVSKGVSAMKTLAGTPKAIGAYRSFLSGIMGEKFENSRLDKWLKELELFKTSKLAGIDPQMYGFDFGKINEAAPFWVRANNEAALSTAKVAYQDLQNKINDWRYKNILPQDLKNMKAQWEFLSAGTKLRNVEIQWKNPKEAMGIIGGLLPFLRFFFK